MLGAKALGLVADLSITVLVLNVNRKSIALCCVNAPTVDQIQRLGTKSKQAARLIHALPILINIAGCTPFINLSTLGLDSREADFTTRYMNYNNILLRNT